MKRIIIFFIICMVCLFASSCTSAPPESDADELELHEWTMSGEQSGSISFASGKVSLASELPDGREIKINGNYYADDSTLTVITPDEDTLVFGYDIVDNALDIEYAGMTLSFIKSGVKE